MKKITLFLVAVIIFWGCDRNNNPDDARHINCDGLVTDTLGTNDNGRIYMPSAFSPNGDGKNDAIRPITQNISSVSFTVYDENNNIVFNTAQIGQAWQPAAGTTGVVKYYYKIQVVTINNHKIGTCGDLYQLSCFPTNVPRSSLYFQDQLTPNGFTGTTLETLSNCP
jgi:hypothetical protein